MALTRDAALRSPLARLCTAPLALLLVCGTTTTYSTTATHTRLAGRRGTQAPCTSTRTHAQPLRLRASNAQPANRASPGRHTRDLALHDARTATPVYRVHCLDAVQQACQATVISKRLQLFYRRRVPSRRLRARAFTTPWRAYRSSPTTFRRGTPAHRTFLPYFQSHAAAQEHGAACAPRQAFLPTTTPHHLYCAYFRATRTAALHRAPARILSPAAWRCALGSVNKRGLACFTKLRREDAHAGRR